MRRPIRRDGTTQQAQCSPPRIALSVSPRRALWSAIRSASSAGARSRGAAAPCLAVRCPLDVFLEATFGGNVGVPNLPGSVRWRRPTMRDTVASWFSVACDHSAAGMPASGCSYAGTIHHVHTGTACFAHLRDHAVCLMKRRGRHCLRGGCDGQSKCNSDEPNHCHLQYDPSKKGFLEEERTRKSRVIFLPIRRRLIQSASASATAGPS